MSGDGSFIEAGLTNPTEAELSRLATVLWGFPDPEPVEAGVGGTTGLLRSGGLARFRPFLDHYKLLVLSYSPLDNPPVLQCHEDLLLLILALKASPHKRKWQIAQAHFRRGDGKDAGPKCSTDEDAALNLALTVMTMVNTISQGTSAVLLEEGSNRTPWRWEVSVGQYISLVLPRKSSLAARYGEEPLFLDINSPLLMARDLKRLAGVSFRGTNDISNHLRYDPINNVLSIFHHAAFLKEQLRLTKDAEGETSGPDRGVLPRQFVLECLYSLQKILFPLWDTGSVRLLQTLVDKASFDPDVLECQDASFIHDDEEKIQFTYLGGRLAELYEELQSPRPRGRLASWLERRSGARYVMLATVVGVGFAVLLGMAGLGLSGYQAWLTYQTMKHPSGA